MSLLNANAGNSNVSTIHVTKIYRNRSTESFGQSLFTDFRLALEPASRISCAIARRRALWAIKKRDKVIGTPSAYINALSNYSPGHNMGVSGRVAEGNLFDYIAAYCNMEVYAFKTLGKLGSLTPKIQTELANPPQPSAGHLSKMLYANKVIVMCKWERFKVFANKIVKKVKAGKTEVK